MHRHNRKMHTWPICWATGKRRFGERWDARQALEHARNLRAAAALAGVESSAQMVRTYRCEACCGWHLTSQYRSSAA